MSWVGVNIGALAVKVVALRDGAEAAPAVRVEPHHGRPLEVLSRILERGEFADAAWFGVSGHRGHITEAAAIQRALRETGDRFDAVAALGGESFLVYLVRSGSITHVLSHNKCAAGSGEFLVQQIGRMGLTLDEAIALAPAGGVVPLASRCSVHCKSDITHKLNRKEASPADVLRTLHEAMAGKVAALLDQGGGDPRCVLLIGGVSRNEAMLSALRGRAPGVDFVVLTQSPWFEAWGSALIARDRPEHRAPLIEGSPKRDRLPPLGRFAGEVRIVAAPARQGPAGGPLALGLDAGSTTTKAVLIDPATRGVVASHYTRTRGDPVSASRDCLLALAELAGNPPIGLVATTGSARELTGAWLGTARVHNEISAHAAGAAHFDPTVDTLFEIGGQDSKFVRLRGGVPVDYAMNNACSAGTGSFLEEAASGDLGVDVCSLSDSAMRSGSPVHFKSTCAAFINSDIRVAQQDGHSRDDIVAGLVYAIAENYLGRVKGPRRVGRRIFLQGGVALNPAVGCAIAHEVGRPVVIPPDPELLGALGVALLALDRAGGAIGAPVRLGDLAAREMRPAGRFTCGACDLSCAIDRFEVAGRRFPFGGRCSLFESVWKRSARVSAAPDLVQRRADLIFGAGVARPATPASGPRVGIPRALTTHALYPLYANFLSEVGVEPVLSGVDARGDLKQHAGFCFPAQIAHGAVMDLARRGVTRVLLPHVVRMPRPAPCRDSYLCPITQAGPYVLAKAFPGVRFISPVLDFSHGYAGDTAMAEAAVRKLGVDRDRARRAWARAVDAQEAADRALREMGREAIEQAVGVGLPAVLIAGHSYNAFSAEASQSVGRKLASMGVTAIPADCLDPVEEGTTSWHFANQILNAVALVNRHPNLFLLCVSSFSCTIDAFTHSMLESAMGSKPWLALEIDAHTADAGIQTRLEAFLDVVRNHRLEKEGRGRPFVACRLGRGGRVVRSGGERVPLTDPRVKIHFPNFSGHHTRALGMAARWLGLHPGDPVPLERGVLDAGLRHTSGRECLPLPICIGQILRVHEGRRPGDIAGFYMVRGGAPCASDSYLGYMQRFIEQQRLPDLFLLSPSEKNDHLGYESSTLTHHLMPAILVADILVEIDHVLRAVGDGGSMERFREACGRLFETSVSIDRFHAEIERFVDAMAALPRRRDPAACPRVVVTGDFFTRFDPFFMEGVRDRYAREGIILKPVDLSDFLFYGAYDSVAGAAGGWGMRPGGAALARACTRIFREDGRRYLGHWLAYRAERRAEARYRGLLRRCGLLVAGDSDIPPQFDKASEHISPVIFGEAIPTVGKGLDADREGYDGVIVVGPFNCLPFRISEAILRPVCLDRGMPVLAYESDGYPVPPSFLRQVDVHIQQVLDRARSRRPAGGMSA